MNIKDFEYIAEIAAQESISKAAARLYQMCIRDRPHPHGHADYGLCNGRRTLYAQGYFPLGTVGRVCQSGGGDGVYPDILAVIGDK